MLPVILTAGALWFGYDGWIETDPDMLEHLDFNRYGFRVLAFLGLLYAYRTDASPSAPGWRASCACVSATRSP